MALTGIIIFIIVILAAVLALRFLFGILRVVVVIALAILALALIYMLLTGNDVVGVGPTMTSIIGMTESKFGEATLMVEDAARAMNKSATVAKELAGYVPTASAQPEKREVSS
ncbi:hypothetical protein J4211_05180 [Candidatus Woesearchaeota archaeon]|nr:hypothetical protein [Candidatus Woesearchaeota archaeon]